MRRGKCNRCGFCCKVIVLNLNMNTIEKESKQEDFKFVFNNFKQIKKRLAVKKNPHLKKWKKSNSNVNFYYFTCKQYDNINKKCKIYNNRRRLCSGYPWYDHYHYDDLIIEPFYDKNCGYKIDREIFKIIMILKKIPKYKQYHEKQINSLGK